MRRLSTFIDTKYSGVQLVSWFSLFEPYKFCATFFLNLYPHSSTFLFSSSTIDGASSFSDSRGSFQTCGVRESRADEPPWHWNTDWGKAAASATLITPDALGDLQYNYKSVNPLVHWELDEEIANQHHKHIWKDSSTGQLGERRKIGRAIQRENLLFVTSGSTLVKS